MVAHLPLVRSGGKLAQYLPLTARRWLRRRMGLFRLQVHKTTCHSRKGVVEVGKSPDVNIRSYRC